MDDKFKKKYLNKLENELSDKAKSDSFENDSSSTESSEYIQFKKENVHTAHSFYEKGCEFAEKLLKINPDKKTKARLEEDIATCHFAITPQGAVGFAIIAPLLFILLLVPFVFLLTGNVILIFVIVLLGLGSFIPLMNLPTYMAQTWRMRASNQMVLAVFYLVTYMRHTSNLERAIEFASHHLSSPLNLDFKKIIWDVETRKFDTVGASLENYLVRWREHTPEFVESMHVVVGSLYETSEEKRQDLLDKALNLILEETYDKMLHYAHNLQSPITALHMLGIVLPILGLIILPMVVNFLPDTISWPYIALLYNIVLPVMIYVLGKSMLSKRPSGTGGMQLDEGNPIVKRLSVPSIRIGKKEVPVNLTLVCGVILALFLLLGFSPIILHWFNFADVGWGGENEATSCGKVFCFLGYKESNAEGSVGKVIGPFGLGATIFSIFVPLALIVAGGLYYHLRSEKIIKFRDDTAKLEAEFTGALFQLANRLGDGLPPEIAFDKVAQAMPGTRSGHFFSIISTNIRQLGMGVHEAIFDSKVGALTQYPSTLIDSSMRILTQSAAKGPKIASNAIDNIAKYIREMGRVNERLQDLMAEVISSMKSQINFLAPVITSIVVALASLITTILSQLSTASTSLDTGDDSGSQIGGLLEKMFGDGIPTFYLQIIVGVYVVQIIFLLTVLVNSIVNGSDKISERYTLARNFLRSGLLYAFLTIGLVLVFNVIGASVFGGLN